MATIKSYTDIEQSRKLAEILPLESADYHYIAQGEKSYFYPYSLSSDAVKDYDEEIKYIPCWSLAALLKIIPKRIKGYNVLRIDISEDFAIWYDDIGFGVNNRLPDITMECPVDACVAMIEKLHELKML